MFLHLIRMRILVAITVVTLALEGYVSLISTRMVHVLVMSIISFINGQQKQHTQSNIEFGWSTVLC